MDNNDQKKRGVDQGLRELAASAPLRLKVRGSCMVPLIEDNAVVEINSKRLYLPGDVLVFRRADGKVLVHRLLGCYPGAGGLHYVTKADTALGHDAPITGDKILGKVIGGEVAQQVCTVPFARRLQAFFLFLRYAVQRICSGRI